MKEAFRVADGLQGGGNEGEPNGDVEVPFDSEGDNLWEMQNLILETKNTILIQWLWKMQ